MSVSNGVKEQMGYAARQKRERKQSEIVMKIYDTDIHSSGRVFFAAEIALHTEPDMPGGRIAFGDEDDAWGPIIHSGKSSEVNTTMSTIVVQPSAGEPIQLLIQFRYHHAESGSHAFMTKDLKRRYGWVLPDEATARTVVVEILKQILPYSLDHYVGGDFQSIDDYLDFMLSSRFSHVMPMPGASGMAN